MAGETEKVTCIDSAVSLPDGTVMTNWGEFTETEILQMGANAFAERDELEQQIRELDREIKQIATAFSVMSKTWGYTPLMFRNEIKRRGLARD